MKTSVVIPTYNGAHKLPAIIKTLLSQTILPNEVIIVVDGSTDDTKNVLRSLQLPSYFKIVIRENGGRAAVRNTGAQIASGDLLIFFDDDMLPAEDCVSRHLQHHSDHPGSILSGAQIDCITEVSTDFQKFKSHLSMKWANELRRSNDFVLLESDVFITAANCSLSKNTFEALGAFDERLTDAEDFDLAVRAYELKIQVFYDHRVFAWHNDPTTCRKYIDRTKQYTEAQSRLRELKPCQMSAITKYQKAEISWMKKAIFYFFASDFWIKIIDSSKWLKMLPKYYRFKLYDVVLTANGVYFDSSSKLAPSTSFKFTDSGKS